MQTQQYHLEEYELREDEMPFAQRAIHALTLDYDSRRLQNNHKSIESFNISTELLAEPTLPAIWYAVLHMSLARNRSRDTTGFTWANHVAEATDGWQWSKRELKGLLYENLEKMLKKVEKNLKMKRRALYSVVGTDGVADGGTRELTDTEKYDEEFEEKIIAMALKKINLKEAGPLMAGWLQR